MRAGDRVVLHGTETRGVVAIAYQGADGPRVQVDLEGGGTGNFPERDVRVLEDKGGRPLRLEHK